MSYGVNAPWGMQVQNSITGAPWTGQLTTLPIASGYAQNIFAGDLVAINTQGYLINYYDLITGGDQQPNQSAAPVGVFAGCSFSSNNQSAVDFASPGRPYWPANTLTFQNLDATGFFISDPNAVFDIQAASQGFSQSSVGQQVNVLYQINAAGLVNGNTQNGTSLMAANVAAIANPDGADRPLMITKLSPANGNFPNIQYNNALVIIRNHFYRTAPKGNIAPGP